MVTTVAAILANPCYTGRQVWNRQHTAPPDRGIPRQRDVQRRDPAQEWAISERPAHPPLVSEEQFVTVQAIHTAPISADGITRTYAFAGQVYCGICGRSWTPTGFMAGRVIGAGTDATAPRRERSQSPKILYVREDHLVDRLVRSGRLQRDLTACRHRLGVYLRARYMIMVCDHATWTIETETEVIPLVPPRDGRLGTANPCTTERESA